MMYLHLRHVITRQSSSACPEPPLADFLTEKRAGLATHTGVPKAGAFKGLSAKRHVHAQRHYPAKLDRLGPVVKKRDDCPMASAVVRKPLWSGSAPYGQYFSAYRSEEHTSELQSLAYLVCR